MASIILHSAIRRHGAFAARSLSTATGSGPAWFVDDDEPAVPARRVVSSNLQPIPPDSPDVLRKLHAELVQMPHLDPESVLVSRPIMFSLGPPLPLRAPQGRRKRGGTNPGDSMYDMPNGIWNWIVLAQVKEGTEGRGTIESVVRVVRKTLLEVRPPLPLPPNAKRRMLNEWAMIDAGDFAVHVLSKTVRERYFALDPNGRYYES